MCHSSLTTLARSGVIGIGRSEGIGKRASSVLRTCRTSNICEHPVASGDDSTPLVGFIHCREDSSRQEAGWQAISCRGEAGASVCPFSDTHLLIAVTFSTPTGISVALIPTRTTSSELQNRHCPAILPLHRELTALLQKQLLLHPCGRRDPVRCGPAHSVQHTQPRTQLTPDQRCRSSPCTR